MGPRQWALDASIAAVLGGYAIAEALTSEAYPHPGWTTALLMGGAGASLALRRFQPTLGFVAAMGLMTAAAFLVGPFQAGSSLLIGLVACYSATAYSVGWPIFGGLGLLFAIVDNRGAMPAALGGVAFVAIFLGLAGAGGYLLRRLRELSAANAALRELIQRESESTTRAAVEDERSRVARELHDILSHSLGVVVLQTGAAEHAWESDPRRAREAVHSARVTSLEAIEQLRTLLTVVRDDPSADRAPLHTMRDLGDLAARTTEAGFRVDMEILGEERNLSPQVQASVYRVTQEGIVNAMKHSGASGCRIVIDYQPDSVVVEVDDDGGESTSTAGSRLGLAGIRERAHLFGGRVDAGPRDSGGWRLRVAFPS